MKAKEEKKAVDNKVDDVKEAKKVSKNDKVADAKQAKKDKKAEKAKKKLDLKKIKIPISPKRLALIMALIALVSFGYKLTIGILAMSTVMIIAAIPCFFIFLCKALYAKNMDQTREQKKKAYLFILIFTASFSLLFILFSTLKVGGIDISHQNTLTGWIGILFIFFIIVMFVLSIINLKGALQKNDLVVIGIKEITFVSALADAVMINEFVYRVILSYVLKYVPIPLYEQLNNLFPLAVGIIMALVPIFMLKRYIKYKV